MKELGVTNVIYNELSHDNKLLVLNTNERFFKEKLDHGIISQVPSFIRQYFKNSGVYLFDIFPFASQALEVDPLYSDILSQYNYAHSFRIIKKVPDGENLKTIQFGLYAPQDAKDINHIYINHIEKIDAFMRYAMCNIEEWKNTHIQAITLLNNATLSGSGHLSPVQYEVLLWLKKGKTAYEKAKIMNKSKRTIEWHFQNICERLGVFSKTQALIKAMDQGLI